MRPSEKAGFSLTDVAKAALSLHFGNGRPPSPRVFFTFLCDSGLRLELFLDAPVPDDATFTVESRRFMVNRQLWLQTAPLIVDSDEAGFRFDPNLDSSQAGGSCGGDCHAH